MAVDSHTTILHGGCHCGGLRIELSTRLVPREITPRACDCSFCIKHAAAYVSDPTGHLRVSVRSNALQRYRQGSNSADFLICAVCGVLVAVSYEQAGRLYAAINAGCLDDPVVLGERMVASPQLLSENEKRSRWMKLWIADVELTNISD